MNNMKDEPPHVDAKVGPVEGVSGQLQLIWNVYWFFTKPEMVNLKRYNAIYFSILSNFLLHLIFIIFY